MQKANMKGMKQMKRLITCILALMMLLSCAAYAASHGDFVRVFGCKEFITLREEPSTGAKAIVQIPLGALVTRYEYTDNGFARVYYGGYFGFVQSKYISEINPETGGE